MILFLKKVKSKIVLELKKVPYFIIICIFEFQIRGTQPILTTAHPHLKVDQKAFQKIGLGRLGPRGHGSNPIQEYLICRQMVPGEISDISKLGRARPT